MVFVLLNFCFPVHFSTDIFLYHVLFIYTSVLFLRPDVLWGRTSVMYHLMGCLLCFINRKPSCFNCCVRFLGQDHDFCNVLNKKKTKEKRCLLLDVVSRLGLSPLKVIFTTSKMMPTLELESVFCPRCTGVRLEKVYSTAISSSVSPKKPK